MANHYSDPTANAAIGSIDREMRTMRKTAEWLGRMKSLGLLSPEQIANARRQFTGIFAPILENALRDTSGTKE